MALRNKEIKPPGLAPRRLRQKALRALVHLLGLIGIAVIYYIAFSFFFDTPLEYRMKTSTQKMKREYEELSARYDTIEKVLENLIERDRNVFRILFESEPYSFDSDWETTRWMSLESLLEKNEKELRAELSSKTARLDKKLGELTSVFTGMREKLETSGDRLDFIPAIQPVNNSELTKLTASYGMRIHPFYKSLAPHLGVDYTVPVGTSVFATADGRVKDVISRRSSSGLTVVLSHGNGYETEYSHLSRINVKVGDRVNRGDIIASSGNTGLSLSPHLHYEIRHNGMRIDPIHYFFLELSPSEYKKLIDIANSGMQSFD